MKALELLETSTVAHLRKLCFNTGTPSTGSKSIIIENLRQSFTTQSTLEYATPNNGTNFTVLSIDMGIRNFAFTKLELDKRLPFNTPPLVKEWTKFDVNEWFGKPQTSSFDPIEYAKLTSKLVDHVLIPKDQAMPDAILIERQRVRSGGSSVVQEWVFRVNMLEAMLHSLIYARVQAEKKSRVDVVSTSAQRMVQFWKPEDDDHKSSETKRLRISLVDKWLNDSVYPKSGARQMIQLDQTRFKLSKELASLSKSQNRWLNQVLELQSEYAKQCGESANASNNKVDDLTDCLLHGVSYLEWQHNRMILKLEMLSGLENALNTSDKMYESHYKQLEFLKAKMSSKPNTKPSTKTKRSVVKKETKRKDQSSGGFVPIGKEGDLKNVLDGMRK